MTKNKEIVIFAKYIDGIKRYTISSLVTFGAIFLSVVVTQLSDLPSVEWSQATVAAIIVVAVRAGLKIVVEKTSGKILEAGL